MTRKFFPFLLSLTFAMAAPALADDHPDSASPETSPVNDLPELVSYTEHVAPILFENCLECHRPQQIGPMSLRNYEDTRPWAKSIKTAVTQKTMPPWFSDDPHGKFKNEMRLTDREIALISRWVDQGARQGDPSKMPEAPVFDDEAWLIGKPDHIFTMEPFHVGDDIEDYYHHTKITANFPEDRWVEAVELHPGNRSLVHHILVFMQPSDKPLIGNEFDSDMYLLGKWAPGNNPDVFTDGLGKKIPAGYDIVFQVHYHKEPGEGSGGTDASLMGVKWADGPAEHPVTTAWILHPEIELQPGDDNYSLTSTFRFIDDGTIYALGPHMHLRGKAARFEAEYPDGTREVLLNVPTYDFNWQINYYFAEPKHVPRGTKVHFTAWYDNSANNPFNPDPSELVTWGLATTDEMMIGYMDYTYDTKKQFQRVLALPEGMLNSRFGDEMFDDDDRGVRDGEVSRAEEDSSDRAS